MIPPRRGKGERQPHAPPFSEGQSEGPEASRLRKLRPRREAGAPSTGDCDIDQSVRAPPGVFMVAPPEVPHNAGRKAKARLLRGSLALDALHLLPRDVDRSGELVGLRTHIIVLRVLRNMSATPLQ